MPVIEGVPRYGYVLEGGIGPVGVILLISSQRGDQIIANLSSWYVEPQWRSHSTLLIAVATKLKHVTYLNASPAPHTWRTLQAQGFTPYNFGRSAVFALPGRGHVSENIPDDLPEAQLLRDHRDAGLDQPDGGKGRHRLALCVQAAHAGQAAGAGDGRDVRPLAR